jgi:hypothetical protein
VAPSRSGDRAGVCAAGRRGPTVGAGGITGGGVPHASVALATCRGAGRPAKLVEDGGWCTERTCRMTLTAASTCTTSARNLGGDRARARATSTPAALSRRTRRRPAEPHRQRRGTERGRRFTLSAARASRPSTTAAPCGVRRRGRSPTRRQQRRQDACGSSMSAEFTDADAAAVSAAEHLHDVDAPVRWRRRC